MTTSREDQERDTMRPEAAGAVLPEAGADTPVEPPEGADGSQDAPEAASRGDDAPVEEVRQTAPVFPAELVVTSHMHFFQKLPGGGMQLKLATAVITPAGPRPQIPSYVFEFDAAGWERFKRAIAADGEAPAVEVASALPGVIKL